MSEAMKKNLYTKTRFWQFLTQLANEDFVVKFIREFNLFEVYSIEGYQEIFFVNIAIYKKVCLLEEFIKYQTKKVGRNLIFAFDKVPKI